MRPASARVRNSSDVLGGTRRHAVGEGVLRESLAGDHCKRGQYRNSYLAHGQLPLVRRHERLQRLAWNTISELKGCGLDGADVGQTDCVPVLSCSLWFACGSIQREHRQRRKSFVVPFLFGFSNHKSRPPRPLRGKHSQIRSAQPIALMAFRVFHRNRARPQLTQATAKCAQSNPTEEEARIE